MPQMVYGHTLGVGNPFGPGQGIDGNLAANPSQYKPPKMKGAEEI